ncbi:MULTISPECIES: asparagine synthase (glutamine-hydrolyzing) [Pseudomonas]|uniref:asparagine synthase (glutamine-hydrolyzing) n=1 Tax=Pseudomonas TaxID=286 RepID=UPI00048A340A|nr:MULTISPECIES: asparagine synthase (glutamine-hydrolyzing) [Pseudomonas]PRA58945.1 asparagine synthetase B [Pseudomonas sp. MYb115]QXN48829.1 asparagine synthase (glutamine-hydrolyzing) [Pseudomonas fluorescens]WSO23139.1 asparagine synthase (glutamine-hydrolyzing) [Pseudomonas fluorescens]
MCGIAGFWHPNSQGRYDGLTTLTRMTNAILRRGPDDSGAWENGAGLFLGHRRLAIVDLSSAGHQPMASPTGRYVIVFNGEIYNFQALRKALDASQQSSMAWRGHSDTEVMLAAFEHWGIKETLSKLVGMFALAVWDRTRETLTLARDRMGEKPLYYGINKGALIFASELQAFDAHPSFEAEVSRESLALLLKYAYVPSPHSIYKGIYKLPPGTWIELDRSTLESGIVGAPNAYWELPDTQSTNRLTISDSEVIDQLEELMRTTIREQMMADVPLGAFLSGGIDSSLIVGLMQSLSQQQVKTFTIGFDNPGYNEAEHAKAVARHLGTDHTELYVTGNDALNVVPKLPDIYGEPFADSSQIPTYLVSQLARSQVTVSLSGDAGDELFGGYNRYQYLPNVWRKLKRVPGPARRLAARMIESASPGQWDSLASGLMPITPARLRVRLPGDKLHKLATVMRHDTPGLMYDRVVSQWPNAWDVVKGTRSNPNLASVGDSDFAAWMMRQDTLSYLPDDILAKVDRAAMAVSLETRVPFLDHRIVEFASSLPMSFKIRNGNTKWILRQLLDRYVPRELIERPKMGFGIPLHEWLRGPLREWAEALLDPQRLASEGYFEPSPIRAIWERHLRGQGNYQHQLWPVLMFQAWLDRKRVI